MRVVGTATDGYKPYFYVTTPDLGTYQSGLSEFTRIYGNDATLEIVAPPVLGSGRFEGWFLNGARVTQSNHLTVPLQNGSYLYQASFPLRERSITGMKSRRLPGAAGRNSSLEQICVPKQ